MDHVAMEKLLGIRDGVGVAKNLIACLYMAAQAPTLASNDRAALCAVSNVAREQLEAVERALDAVISQARSG